MKFSVAIAGISALFSASLTAAVPTSQSQTQGQARPFRTKAVGDSICDAGSKQLTGHVNVTDDHSLFFWYTESRKNPKKDPLLVWLQGGPGSSSLLGMFTENGPCFVKEDATGTVRNPHSWTEFANVVYVDQPAGVGFSMDYGKTSVGTLDEGSSDLAIFMETFTSSVVPYLKDSKVIMSGESFGGHYIPHFLKHYDQGVKAGKYCPLNFMGAAIGNGLVDWAADLMGAWELACVDNHDATGFPTVFQNQSACAEVKPLIAQCKVLQTGCINDGPDNGGHWDKCRGIYPSDNATASDPVLQNPCWKVGMFGSHGDFGYDGRYPNCEAENGTLPAVLDNCPLNPRLEAAMNIYLPSQKVMNALGLDPKVYNYTDSSDAVYDAFSTNVAADFLRPTVAEVEYMLKNMNIKVLFYNGNSDLMMNTPGQTQMLNEAIRWDGQEKFKSTEMSDWHYQDRGSYGSSVVGKTKSYKQLQFTTINKASHMSPTDQPGPVLLMMQNWLKGEKLT